MDKARCKDDRLELTILIAGFEKGPVYLSIDTTQMEFIPSKTKSCVSGFVSGFSEENATRVAHHVFSLVMEGGDWNSRGEDYIASLVYAHHVDARDLPVEVAAEITGQISMMNDMH